MDRLTLLSQDKATLKDLKDFFELVLNDEIVKKTLAREDTSGYAEASEIIKKSLAKINDLYKEEVKKDGLNKSE